MSGRLAALLLLIALAIGVSIGGGDRVAEAHALLVRADPPVNSQLRTPPTELTLYFSEPLEQKYSTVRVVDQNNARVDDHVEFDDTNNAVMHVFLKDVQPGYITVDWATVSLVDGHRVTGSYPLTILNPDGSVPAGKPPSAGSSVSGTNADVIRVIAKWFILAGAAFLTGAMAFVVFISPIFQGPAAERSRRALDRVALIIAGVSLVVMLLAGLLELQRQAHIIGVSISSVLDTRWGRRWLARLVVTGVIVVLTASLVVTKPGSARRLVGGLGFIGCLGFLGLVSSVSHSAAGDGAFWAAGADFIHLLTASLWIGLLALMAVMFIYGRRLADGERYQVLAAGLQRFSAIAVISLALLLFTGTFNAVIEVGQLSDLLHSGYGFTLLLKLLLIIPLLAVGIVNAYILRPELVTELAVPGNPQGHRETLRHLEARLRNLIRVELALALGVLAIVAVLVQLTPTRGRLDVGGQAGKYIQSMDQDGISATLVVDPNQPGINTFEVDITGAVDTVQQVRLDFTQPGTNEARLVLEASNSNPAYFYLGKGPYLGQPGDWQIGVDIRRSVGNDLLLPFKVTVPASPSASATSPENAFAFPVSLTVGSAALLALAGVLALGFVYAGVARPGRPGGYAGPIAIGLAGHMPRWRPAYSLGGLIIIGVGLGSAIRGSFAFGVVEQAGDGGQSRPVDGCVDPARRDVVHEQLHAVSRPGRSRRRAPRQLAAYQARQPVRPRSVPRGPVLLQPHDQRHRRLYAGVQGHDQRAGPLEHPQLPAQQVRPAAGHVAGRLTVMAGRSGPRATMHS